MHGHGFSQKGKITIVSIEKEKKEFATFNEIFFWRQNHLRDKSPVMIRAPFDEIFFWRQNHLRDKSPVMIRLKAFLNCRFAAA